MANLSIAFEKLTNMSVVESANEAYKANVIIGNFFWPIIFLFTLFLLYLKTENPTYLSIYTIIGAFVLGKWLINTTQPIFYITLVLSIGLTLWSIFGSPKID